MPDQKETRQALLAVLLLCLCSPFSWAAQSHDDNAFEEIVVTSPFRQTEAETAMPVGVLSGEALRENASSSLGDTLDGSIGIVSASFGSGVGHPVIRGHSRQRVKVLQNGIPPSDVSTVSPDHAEGVEAVLAERIEVLRGPSALLYGNGAIGGVINVIDGRVPDSRGDTPRWMLEQSHNTVNDEDRSVVRADVSRGPLAFHVSGFNRDSNNVRIPGYAIDEQAVEREEELLEGPGHDPAGETEVEHEEEQDEEEHEPLPNTRGFIANSDNRANGLTLGTSWIGDRGFAGMAVNRLNNDYGLPPGTHGHEESNDPEPDHEAAEDGVIRLDMEQTRYDLRAGLSFPERWIESLRGSVGYTDYEHLEFEQAPDGDEHPGVRYFSDGYEGRVELSRAPSGDWTGVWGMQFTDTRVGALGSEAFIPVSDIGSLSLFAVERLQRGDLTGEFGARIEHSSIDPGSSACEVEETATSLSASLMFVLDSDYNLLMGASSSDRAPAVDELYSNIAAQTCSRPAEDHELVLHSASGLREIGNPDLGTETSNNFEFGLRKHRGDLTGELSVYYNRISDYVHLQRHGADNVAEWQADDARFRGVEAELNYLLLEHPGGALDMRLFGDMVRAEREGGEDLPRIPPSRGGLELRYYSDFWSVRLTTTRVSSQNHTAATELRTSGYTRLSLYADYHWSPGGDTELLAYLRGENLLDETIRSHTSHLRHFAPEPGRGFSVGLRISY